MARVRVNRVLASNISSCFLGAKHVHSWTYHLLIQIHHSPHGMHVSNPPSSNRFELFDGHRNSLGMFDNAMDTKPLVLGYMAKGKIG